MVWFFAAITRVNRKKKKKKRKKKRGKKKEKAIIANLYIVLRTTYLLKPRSGLLVSKQSRVSFMIVRCSLVNNLFCM